MSDALAAQVHLHRDAVRNWARLAGAPAEPHAARIALLSQIAACGELSGVAPAWMTSPRPGIDHYLTVGRVVLLVKDEVVRGRPLHAVNAVSPRRGGIARAERAQLAPSPAPWPAEVLAALGRLAGAELAQRTWLSAHCLERARERALIDGEEAPARLRALIASDGQVSELPAWANAAGVGGIAIVCDEGRFAFPVARDHKRLGEDPLALMATTCMVREWVRRTLTELSRAQLAEQVRVSSTALRACELDEEALRDAIRAHGQVELSADGARLLLGERVFRLRPQSAQGVERWTVCA